MNLGYKRMELQAALNVVGGAFTAGAVYAGLGLVVSPVRRSRSRS